MPISRILSTYLNHERVHYDVLPHPEAFRALAIAQMLHTSEKKMAKIVIVKVGMRFVMTVLPANWKVDLHRLRIVFATHSVRLATEDEIAGLFPDCELGAMPPFGNLYKIPVYVDCSLAEDEEIIFQGGTHSDAIRMRYWDFAALVFPVVAEFHRSPAHESLPNLETATGTPRENRTAAELSHCEVQPERGCLTDYHQRSTQIGRLEQSWSRDSEMRSQSA
jgi:Ala-tRNA(Pro) deacylase